MSYLDKYNKLLLIERLLVIFVLLLFVVGMVFAVLVLSKWIA
jgi:hypothetical protein